ncbi:hypothetical protein [Stenotrophomonas sp.]|uniref:hypothetical protein n=1 Tax=Stenotrophomonas sp. TaxID=69392 RepID=UPI0028AA052A|nr:hypothetical protein [Stenotrophomonas sp.]
MSAPVDVLAVMDREAKIARHYRIESGAHKVAEDASADAAAARAAVAELIEACESLSGDPHAEDLAALASALARVKGGAA